MLIYSPISCPITVRGGIHEMFTHAEIPSIDLGLAIVQDDYRSLNINRLKSLFCQ